MVGFSLSSIYASSYIHTKVPWAHKAHPNESLAKMVLCSVRSLEMDSFPFDAPIPLMKASRGSTSLVLSLFAYIHQAELHAQ